MTKTIVDMAKKKWLRQGDRIYQYVIISHLSSGGMGEVYYGEDTFSSEKIAIKFLAPDLANDKEMVRRFDLEARLLKNTNHKNVVKIKDYGQYRGIPYIVMEYLEGISLKEIIQNKLTDVQTSIEVLEQLLDAVGHIHRLNIIHRDLKPSNILCLQDMSVKIIDFGIAKDLDEEGDLEITRVGDVIGSTQYLAPEQIRGDKRTLQSDIRNLGMIFFEMLVWKYPFEFKNKLDLIDKIKTENIKFPLGTGIPISIQNIVLRMTDIDLTKRYQSTLKAQIDIDKLDSNVYANAPSDCVFSEDHTFSQIKIQKFINTEARKTQIKRHIIKVASQNKKFGFKLYLNAFAVIMLILAIVFVKDNSKKIQEMIINQKNDVIANWDNQISKIYPDKKNKTENKNQQQRSTASKNIPNDPSLVTQKARENSKVISKSKPKVRRVKPILIKRPQLKSKKQTYTIKHYSRDAVYLSWFSQHNVKYYDLEVSKNKNFKTRAFFKKATSESSVAWRPMTPGRYYWRVRAYSLDLKSDKYSRVGIINLKSAKPRVIISNPSGGRSPVSVGQSANLIWNDPGYKSKFKVQVSRSKKFAKLEKSFFTNNTKATIKLHKIGTHYFRVYEVDAESKQKVSPYSNVTKVNVGPKSSVRKPQSRVIVLAPKLIYPKNESEVNSQALKFSWKGGVLDSGYQIQVSKSRNFSDMVLERSLLLDYMHFKNSLGPGKYYWRVRTKSKNGTSAWSSIYYFIIY